MKLTKKNITVAATGAALLAGAAPAAAQQQLPAVNAYSAPAANIQTQVTPTNSPSPSTNTQVAPTSSVAPAQATKVAAHQLPFTGLDVGLTVAAGAVLLALGFGIRRLVRPTGTA
jgi:hypothetical protein